ncbi:TPA: hypothetical protein ACUNBZ_004639 [Escherichia fergusonii]
MIQIQLAGVIPMSGGALGYCHYDVMFSWLPGTVRFHLPQLAAYQSQ